MTDPAEIHYATLMEYTVICWMEEFAQNRRKFGAEVRTIYVDQVDPVVFATDIAGAVVVNISRP